jgi:hypothetical protein
MRAGYSRRPATNVVPATKFVPVSVTVSAVPAVALAGAIAVSVGRDPEAEDGLEGLLLVQPAIRPARLARAKHLFNIDDFVAANEIGSRKYSRGESDAVPTIRVVAGWPTPV